MSGGAIFAPTVSYPIYCLTISNFSRAWNTVNINIAIIIFKSSVLYFCNSVRHWDTSVFLNFSISLCGLNSFILFFLLFGFFPPIRREKGMRESLFGIGREKVKPPRNQGGWRLRTTLRIADVFNLFRLPPTRVGVSILRERRIALKRFLILIPATRRYTNIVQDYIRICKRCVDAIGFFPCKISDFGLKSLYILMRIYWV